MKFKEKSTDDNMLDLTLSEMNRLVLYKQHLVNESRTKNIVKIVKEIGGLHATSTKVPYQSLFARIPNFSKKDLDEELLVKRNLGKIRSIRGTLYIFPKEVIPIIHVATNKIVESQSRKALEFRGISSDKYKEISESIISILRDKKEEMSASEIKKALQVNYESISYILYLMCDQALLIRSSPRKYTSFNVYFPDIDFSQIDEEQAITQLVQYYLTAFGPVSENDAVWWTGLSKTNIIQALNHIQDRILYVKITNLNTDLMMLASDKDMIDSIPSSKNQIVNFLPMLDPYIMGYKERDRYISSARYNFVFDRTGNATSSILLNGRIIGVWDVFQGGKPQLKLFLFEKTEKNIKNEIKIQAKRLGRFITNKDVLIQECDSMIPLTERSAGSFMSPLKEF
ncbi:MAG: winged helix DNA-binding domain-containing protein [Promethearchaeota archaeon]